MNYYTLSFNLPDLGYFPQNKGITGVYNFNSPDSVYNGLWRSPVGNLHVPEGVMLRPQAKFTDILSIGEITFPLLVVSSKFLDLIKMMELPSIMEIYPINAIKKDKVIEYYVFVLNPVFPEYIDFSKSESIVEDTANKTVTPIVVNDSNHFNELKKSIQPPLFLITHKVRLGKERIKQDIFRLPTGVSMSFYIVSENFVNKAREAGLTGLLFTPVE